MLTYGVRNSFLINELLPLGMETVLRKINACCDLKLPSPFSSLLLLNHLPRQLRIASRTLRVGKPPPRKQRRKAEARFGSRRVCRVGEPILSRCGVATLCSSSLLLETKTLVWHGATENGERWTNPVLSRRTCTCELPGSQSHTFAAYVYM
jgi:hypothetical protein